ncbi:hypothetical protein J3E74DRAFT_286412 [Bipolaris maydis]|nr:hypothetical protein J3E74DRAFT_286412 [Bipolaris maydis]
MITLLALRLDGVIMIVPKAVKTAAILIFFSFLEEVYAKTTQNARAVNKSFEIVFFCIDAFGRVQDPDDDKLMELSKTASIYRGTHCTIAFIFSKAAIRGFLDVQEGGNDAKTWNVNTDAPEVSKSFSRTSTRAAILELRNDFDKPDVSDMPLAT